MNETNTPPPQEQPQAEPMEWTVKFNSENVSKPRHELLNGKGEVIMRSSDFVFPNRMRDQHNAELRVHQEQLAQARLALREAEKDVGLNHRNAMRWKERAAQARLELAAMERSISIINGVRNSMAAQKEGEA